VCFKEYKDSYIHTTDVVEVPIKEDTGRDTVEGFDKFHILSDEDVKLVGRVPLIGTLQLESFSLPRKEKKSEVSGGAGKRKHKKVCSSVLSLKTKKQLLEKSYQIRLGIGPLHFLLRFVRILFSKSLLVFGWW
jgi:hypothetical protein